MRPHKPDHKKKPPRHKGKRPQHAHQGGLPEICVLTITEITEDGELIAEPVKQDPRRKPPRIVVIESGRQRAADKGDRILAKLKKIRADLYQALLIRVLPKEEAQAVLGVFTATSDGGIIEPVSRKMKESFMVARPDVNGAIHGELVSGMTLPGVPSMSMGYAKITERLGRLDSPRAASLIASNMHNLPSVFSAASIAESEAAPPPVMSEERSDLRAIPLVTIDGEDARDFDDAVFAEPDGDGFHIIIAIADVAHYVSEGSALDADASERGNSVYFPDRVIPMLPERLSNGLCSLMPNEDRYCLAVHIWIDAQGNMKRYQFVRGLMRSVARLTYEQVEGLGGQSSEVNSIPTSDLRALIPNLYSAYAALAHERDHRGALDLNLPEYKIIFDAAGSVADIRPRERLESHRLIEAYMIAANVAAADFLLKNKAPGIYRVHEPPSDEKLEDVRQLLKISGYSLHVGAGIKGAHFNRVLKSAEGKPEQYMVNTAILRSQMQAFYSAENLGHFGLALQKYCHFTSPIRRYADLVVHRALAGVLGSSSLVLGKHSSKHQALSTKHLPEVALHISETERRAMLAERDASDRYKVAFMSRQIGNTFSGTVSGLNEYGLFVSLSDTGVTGFIPVRNLPGDFYHYDKRHSCFKGQRSKQVFNLGQPLIIRVQAANAITGSLIFEIQRPNAPPIDRPLRPAHKKHRHKDRKRR